MVATETILCLLVAVVALATLARRLHIAEPIPLTAMLDQRRAWAFVRSRNPRRGRWLDRPRLFQPTDKVLPIGQPLDQRPARRSRELSYTLLSYRRRDQKSGATSEVAGKTFFIRNCED